jgi:hypothetical protein
MAVLKRIYPVQRQVEVRGYTPHQSVAMKQ